MALNSDTPMRCQWRYLNITFISGCLDRLGLTLRWPSRLDDETGWHWPGRSTAKTRLSGGLLSQSRIQSTA